MLTTIGRTAEHYWSAHGAIVLCGMKFYSSYAPRHIGLLALHHYREINSGQFIGESECAENLVPLTCIQSRTQYNKKSY